MSRERSTTPEQVFRLATTENKPRSILDNPVIREMYEAGKFKGKKIAVILDGNGRWAEEHGLSVTEGHKAGAEATKAIMQACKDLEMDVSLWILSPNNLAKRSRKELKGIDKILRSQMGELVNEADRSNGRIMHVGETYGLSLRLRYQLWRAQRKTKNNTGPVLGLAVNYGGIEQIKRIAKRANREKRGTNYDAEGKIESMMYGGGVIKPVDILIRTGKVKRLSGLEKPFTGDHTELFFPDVYLPDFDLEIFEEILIDFDKRTRTLGGRNGHSVEQTKPFGPFQVLFKRN
ncbi:MAG: polyprenyl diphosphate synthase [Candidatus Levyibacteriota bacterium]